MAEIIRNALLGGGATMNGTCSRCGSREPWDGCPLCFTPEPEPVHNDDDDAPRTTQLEDCDYHKLDDDFAPIACYNRMVEHAKELERELADAVADANANRAMLHSTIAAYQEEKKWRIQSEGMLKQMQSHDHSR